jgi:hypothetical protein
MREGSRQLINETQESRASVVLSPGDASPSAKPGARTAPGRSAQCLQRTRRSNFRDEAIITQHDASNGNSSHEEHVSRVTALKPWCRPVPPGLKASDELIRPPMQHMPCKEHRGRYSGESTSAERHDAEGQLAPRITHQF